MLSGTWQFGSVKTITAAEINQCEISATRPAIAGKPAIGTITAKGWINDCNITATGAGNIGTISAGGIKDCNFSTGGSIGKIENKGIRDNSFCYINSDITADHIGTANLAYLKYSNIIDGEHTSFRLTAASIDKLTIKESNHKNTWLGLDSEANPIVIGDFKINFQ